MGSYMIFEIKNLNLKACEAYKILENFYGNIFLGIGLEVIEK